MSERFFHFNHIFIGLCLATVAAVLLATLGYASWQLIEPEGEVTGFLGQLESIRVEEVVYHGITIQNEQNQLLLVRLEENGRILSYLQDATPNTAVTVRYRDGYATELITPTETVTDSSGSLWLHTIVILSSLLLLLFFFRPSIVENVEKTAAR